MSWFTGISNITGNLSTFTKDLLSEGTEEVEDVASALLLSNNKVRELESVLSTLHIEIEELKLSNEELQLQSQSVQQQLHQSHDYYRQQLLEKDEEIRCLKLEKSSQMEGMSTVSQVGDWSLNSLSLDTSHLDFASEDQPFSEIQLHDDLGKVRPSSTEMTMQLPSGMTPQHLCEELRNMREEKLNVEKQLEVLEETRQSELFAMQSSYEKKMFVLNQSCESKLEKLRAEYETKIQELNQKLTELTSQKESSNGASDGWDNCGDLTEEETVLAAISSTQPDYSSSMNSANDSITLLEFSTSPKQELQSNELEELRKIVLHQTDVIRQLENDIENRKQKEDELKHDNETLSEKVKDATQENDNLLKHPMFLLYNSLNNEELQMGRCAENEKNLHAELDRLRAHLLEMSSSKLLELNPLVDLESEESSLPTVHTDVLFSPDHNPRDVLFKEFSSNLQSLVECVAEEGSTKCVDMNPEEQIIFIQQQTMKYKNEVSLMRSNLDGLQSQIEKREEEAALCDKFLESLRMAFTLMSPEPMKTVSFDIHSPTQQLDNLSNIVIQHLSDYHLVKMKLEQLHSLLLQETTNSSEQDFVSIEPNECPDLPQFIDAIHCLQEGFFQTLHQLRQQCTDLRDEKQSANMEVLFLKEHVQKLESSYEAREESSENKNLADHVSSVEDNSQLLFESKEKEIFSLRDTISELQYQMLQCQEKEHEMENMLRQRDTELQEQCDQTKKFDAETQLLKRTLEDYLQQQQKRDDETDGILKERQAELERQCQKTKDLATEVDRLRIDLENCLQRKSEIEELLKQRNRELEAQCSETEKFATESDQLREELEGFLQQQKDREAATNGLLKQREVELETQRQEIESLTREVEKLALQLEQSVTETKECYDYEQQYPDSVTESQINIHSAQMVELEKSRNDIERLYHQTQEELQQVIVDRNQLATQLVSIQNEWEQLVNSLQGKHNECENYYQQLQQLSQESGEQIHSLQTELSRVQESEQNIQHSYQHALRHLAILLEVEETVLSKKDDLEAVSNLVTTRKKDIQQTRFDMGRYAENEKKLHTELDRLRAHLLEMEENFTQEALQAEAREDKLRRQLMASEEANSQYSSTTAAQHEFYIDQVETLKEENSLAWSKIHDYEENVRTLNHENGTLQEQVNKLQSVLINYETEREVLVRSETERLHRDVTQLKEQCGELEKHNEELRSQITSQQEVSEAARRLTVQMKKAEEETNRLRNIIDQRDVHIHQLLQELQHQKTVLDTKIDKLLAKNLIMGYFHAPANKRGEAVRVIGSLLGFTDVDFEKIGVDASNRSGWFSWMKRDPALGKIREEEGSNKDSSFSQLFIQFLEHESNPGPSLKLSTDILLTSPTANVSRGVGRQRMSTSFSGTQTSLPSSIAPVAPTALTSLVSTGHSLSSTDMNPLLRGIGSPSMVSSHQSHLQNL